MSEFEENKPQRKASVFTEKYSPERLNALKRLINNQNQQGIKRDFSISIDGEVIVPRSSEPLMFDTYQRYIEAHTKTIEVRLYFGESPNSNLYIFDLEGQSANQSLGSIPAGQQFKEDDRIELILQKKDLENQLNFIKYELKRNKKKVKKYKKIKGETAGMDIKELLLNGIEIFKQYNISKQPALVQGQMEGVQESQVQIEPEVELSKVEKKFQKLKANHSEAELEQALAAWSLLAKHPEVMEQVAQIIETKNNSNGKS